MSKQHQITAAGLIAGDYVTIHEFPDADFHEATRQEINDGLCRRCCFFEYVDCLSIACSSGQRADGKNGYFTLKEEQCKNT